MRWQRLGLCGPPLFRGHIRPGPLAAAAGRDSLYTAWRYARALQMEYADKLRPAVAKYAADLVVVMRVYFEKPRTNVGWKVRG